MNKFLFNKTPIFLRNYHFEISTKTLTLEYAEKLTDSQLNALLLRLPDCSEIGKALQLLEPYLYRPIHVSFDASNSISFHLADTRPNSKVLDLNIVGYTIESANNPANLQAAFLELSNKYFALQDTHQKLEEKTQKEKSLLHQYLKEEKEGITYILDSFKFEKKSDKEAHDYKIRYYFLGRVSDYIHYIFEHLSLPNQPAYNWKFWVKRHKESREAELAEASPTPEKTTNIIIESDNQEAEKKSPISSKLSKLAVEALGKDDISDLSTITSLTLICFGREDFKGIELFTGLKTLSIRSSGLHGLYFLKHMPKLRNLEVSHTPLYEIRDIDHTPLLKKVDLYNCLIDEVNVLLKLDYLKKLRLRGLPLKEKEYRETVPALVKMINNRLETPMSQAYSDEEDWQLTHDLFKKNILCTLFRFRGKSSICVPGFAYSNYAEVNCHPISPKQIRVVLDTQPKVDTITLMKICKKIGEDIGRDENVERIKSLVQNFKK